MKYNTAFSFAIASIAANSQNFETVFPNQFTSTNSSKTPYEPLAFQEGIATESLQKLGKLLPKSSDVMIKSFRRLISISEARARRDSLNKNEHYVQLFELVDAATQQSTRIKNNFANETNKLQLTKDNVFFVEQGLKAALELEEKDYIRTAFSFTELNKSILLEDAIKSNQAHNFGDLPDSLALKEKTLQQQKDAIKKQQYQAKTTAEKNVALAAENDLNYQINIFLKSIKDKYPKYHALKYENITAKAEDIQALLDEKTLLLEYFVADSITYLFAISKTEVELFPISISKKRLNLMIKALRKSLSNYTFILNKEKKAYALFTEKAHWFYNTLLKPALINRDKKELIIVSDGELGHLPFEVFLTEAPADQRSVSYKELAYLLKDYTISYAYSATLWKKNFDQEERKNNQQMIAFGASYPKMDSNHTFWELRSPHVSKLRLGLNDLPAAQSEVRTLEANFKGAFFYETAANEANFKSKASNYAIIHLAMHGILHKSMPILSSLAFTESLDEEEDNFLQAYELAHLDLKADLVVLSACETGYGAFHEGEGVMSLARSFMYAGTPSLIVSLWQVNDASTAFIMTMFYQFLAEGMAKNRALKQAKLAYLDKGLGIQGHPAFWSPFIQLGDASPIQFQQKKDYTTLFVIIIVLFIFFFIRYKILQSRAL